MIIIGLGNPGEKFEKTRHNVGFMTVDFFAKEENFPDFELSKKDNALFSKKGSVVLAKPQTFMNKSGVAVKSLSKQSKKGIIVVIHDDLDLLLGKIKIVQNRGSAGHKGIESVIKAVGNKNLVRIRVGIQPKKGKPKQAEAFVVKNFEKEEEQILKKVIEKISEALSVIEQDGPERAMNQYNRPVA